LELLLKEARKNQDDKTFNTLFISDVDVFKYY